MEWSGIAVQRRFPFPFVSCSCSLRVRQFCSLHSHFVAHKTALNFRPLGLRLVARPGARPTHDNGMYIYFPIPGMNSPPGSGGVFQGSPPAPQQLQQQQQQQHGVSSSMSPMSDVIQLGTHQGPPSPSASPTTPAHFRSLPNRGHSSAAAADDDEKGAKKDAASCSSPLADDAANRALFVLSRLLHSSAARDVAAAASFSNGPAKKSRRSERRAEPAEVYGTPRR